MKQKILRELLQRGETIYSQDISEDGPPLWVGVVPRLYFCVTGTGDCVSGDFVSFKEIEHTIPGKWNFGSQTEPGAPASTPTCYDPRCVATVAEAAEAFESGEFVDLVIGD